MVARPPLPRYREWADLAAAGSLTDPKLTTVHGRASPAALTCATSAPKVAFVSPGAPLTAGARGFKSQAGR